MAETLNKLEMNQRIGEMEMDSPTFKKSRLRRDSIDQTPLKVRPQPKKGLQPLKQETEVEKSQLPILNVVAVSRLDVTN